MERKRRIAAIGALTCALVVLAGCKDKSADPHPAAPKIDAKDARIGAAIDNAVAAGGPHAVAPGMPVSAPVSAKAARTTLPSAYQGNWGMTPADCDISRGDPKGLLRIDKDKLDFYASVATVTRFSRSPGNGIAVDVTTDSKGQQGTSQMTLDLIRGGTTLHLRERASPKTTRYDRC